MKVAIYIVEGTTQLVLTPEGDWEKNVTKQFAEGGADAKIMRGNFYECQGGWYREGGSEQSLILRLDSGKAPSVSDAPFPADGSE